MFFNNSKSCRRISVIAMALIICLVTGTACGSDYKDASKGAPNSWYSYTAGDISFKFAPGYTEQDYSSYAETLDECCRALADNRSLTMVSMLASREQAGGLRDFLIIGYYSTRQSVAAGELEDIMDTVNNFDYTLSEGNLNVTMMRNARIRTYGKWTIPQKNRSVKRDKEALTFAVKMKEDDRNAVVSVGLIPADNVIYQFIYANFSTSIDNDYLEVLLSTLAMKQ